MPAIMGIGIRSTALLLIAILAFIPTSIQAGAPTVQLTSGTLVTGKSKLGVETFNGIPYADPPVGPLRLRPPQKLSRALDNVDATGIAAACPQLFVSPADRDIIGGIGSKVLELPFFKTLNGQEDCLTVSIQRPANTKPSDKLPVLFWIYGGGFTFGSTNTYDGSSLVCDGAANKQPFVFVAVNYRVGAFGFMPGIEILREGSANAGYLDQRMGLEWVADNIAQFGGDPDKVTIWGESAGSMSVFSQMSLYGGDVIYKGKPLFRGAIMNSGTVVPADPIDSPKAQAVYDKVLEEAGCAGATNDTLACLRELDFDAFYKAVTQKFSGAFSYYGAKISFPPRPDGRVVRASPEELAEKGQYHAVPMIVGDQEDEGTLFAIFQRSLKTKEDLIDYFAKEHFVHATRQQITELVDVYTQATLDDGSPHRTGSRNALYSMYKPLAAIFGDLTFTLTRRHFLDVTTRANPDVPAWSYLSSYLHELPILGTFHASDLLQIFYGFPLTHATKSNRQYYMNFLYNLDPNKGKGEYSNWPLWKDNKMLMWFKTQTENGYLSDTFRSKQYDTLMKLGNVLRQ